MELGPFDGEDAAHNEADFVEISIAFGRQDDFFLWGGIIWQSVGVDCETDAGNARYCVSSISLVIKMRWLIISRPGECSLPHLDYIPRSSNMVLTRKNTRTS